MTAKQLFNKTKPFVWAKMVLGGATILISVVLLAIFMGLGWLFGEGAMMFMFILWISATGVVRFIIMHYFGYLVKAGHIAVVAEACKTGQIPANQVEYGKAVVTQRFVTSNVFFAIDKLVTAAVKQVQKGIGKVGDVLDFIPGMNVITGLVQFFADIALGYIDECCLGWVFYNPQDSAYKSAADAVVIYAQNWKVLLKSAAKTLAKTLGLCLLIVLIVFVPIGLLFKLLKWSGFAAFVLACLVAWVVKFAYMDSYIMIQMMASYMEAAPNTRLAFDLYGKLASLSGSFKELWNKGQQEQPASAAAYGTAGQPAAIPAMASGAGVTAAAQPVNNTAAAKPVFCGQCGAKNEAGTKFCGKCGAKL